MNAIADVPQKPHTPWLEIVGAVIALFPGFAGKAATLALKYFGAKRVAAALLVFLAIVTLPLLSVWAMQGVARLLPLTTAQHVQSWVNSTIHQGYGIDAIASRLERSASEKAVNSVNNNNSTLDFIQLVDFYLERQESEKVVPVRLRIGQVAVLTIRKIVPVAFGSGCGLPDVPTAQPILVVSLDRMEIHRFPKMEDAGSIGKVKLSPEWWATHESQAKSQAIDGVFDAVRFTKEPQFEKAMADCVRLRVIADIAVQKLDLALAKP